MPTVKVEDITMYYEFHGEKNANSLVIIPGLGTDLTVYKEIINQLSEEFKVLAFDNRGSGRTDKPDIIYTIEMMANDTAKLIRAVGVNRGNILGISLGGRIALGSLL
ncbi:3-oxoadipate enol-lactonase 2 [Desulfosporosinus acididurans]|uniref:3-oxoadipate enol-lactonase 2 n=2 Tax=Desulfosporosinus acididurans TaxID=476652 RepID=A0A0J1FUV5_9FIRM|nr:3-oxoadipate enol-lactonase 2 [Desulfosporosinus acididurans]